MERIYLSKQTYFYDGRTRDNLYLPKQYPQILSFSYESKALEVCSRIDFFLAARSFSNFVVNIDTKASNAPDHKAEKLTLQLSEERRGPGLWKFNNPLVMMKNV